LDNKRSLCLAIAILGGLLVASACRRPAGESTPVNTLEPTDVSSPNEIGSHPSPTSTRMPTSSPSMEFNQEPGRTTVASTPPLVQEPLQIEGFLPIILNPIPATAIPSPTPSSTPTPLPTPTPTIDFGAVRAHLQSQGQDLANVKIGLHTGVGGNRVGLGDWMRRLDAANVPFFIKSVDDSGPLVEAQEIVRTSGLAHTLVFRRSGTDFDTPDYTLPPEEAAQRHWQLHIEAFPQELDPNLVWLETINEVDKERSDWLGRFAVETAQLALAGGYRWAAFGWSSGEPELTDWQASSMLAFLRLAGQRPDQLAIALHEYSFIATDISHQYPFKIGRFQQLFQLVDQQGIPRPTILITEWGWEYETIPSIDQALEDIGWAAMMYAPYPEIKGAAIWYLGNGFGGIADIVQPLIRPLTEFSLGHYYAISMPPNVAPINPDQFRP